MKKLSVTLFILISLLFVKSYGQDTSKKLNFPKFIIGTTTHFPDQKKGLLKSNLQMIKEAGIMSTRDEITWRKCETRKGEINIPDCYTRYINAAEKLDLMPLTILCYYNRFYDQGGYPQSPEAVEAYVRYCETMVSKYKDKCRIYQVWNEWDGACGMPKEYKGKGSVEGYMKVLRAAYLRIKKISPNAIVVSNAVCSGNGKWLRKLIESGVMKICDVIAYHTYNYPAGTPESWHRRMINLRKRIHLNNNGKDFPVFITEMGWPTQLNKKGVPPEVAAMNLARLYLLARTLPFIKGVWWYDFQDDGWNAKGKEHNFGMIKANMTAKPAYYVMSSISRLVKTANFIRRIPTKDKKIWLLQFKYPDGTDALAMWSEHADNDWKICLRKTNNKDKSIKVYHAGRKAYKLPWGARNWAFNRKSKVRKNELELTLRGLPLIIEGDLSNIKVIRIRKRIFEEKKRYAGNQLPKAFAIASMLDSGKKKVYTFSSDENYRKRISHRKGDKDIDASFSMEYDSKNIYLTVNVIDDEFFQDTDDIEQAWHGDSLQMAFQYPDDSSDMKARTEIDVALTTKGAKAYVREIQKGKLQQLIPDSCVKIDRKGKESIYKLTIPWVKMGFPLLKKGRIIKFSLLVNDNDNKNREGYLHWGAGIGDSKDPSQYNMILLD